MMSLLYALWITPVLAVESPVARVSPSPQAAPGETVQQASAQSEDAFSLREDLFKLRDPFKMPEIEIARIIPKSDLERFPVDAYKLVGVLTGPDRLRALLLAPDGKSYFVSEKMKIGVRGGVIRKITPDVVMVREKFVNVVGQEESIESEIRMASDSRNQPRDGSSASSQGNPMLPSNMPPGTQNPSGMNSLPMPGNMHDMR
jgi:Tfp pilus assembly protein PilP